MKENPRTISRRQFVKTSAEAALSLFLLNFSASPTACKNKIRRSETGLDLTNPHLPAHDLASLSYEEGIMKPTLKARDPHLKLNAIRYCGRLNEPTTIKTIVSFFSDNDENVRQAAGKALIRNKSDEAVKQLIALTRQSQVEDKKKLLDVLLQIDNPGLSEFYLGLLGHGVNDLIAVDGQRIYRLDGQEYQISLIKHDPDKQQAQFKINDEITPVLDIKKQSHYMTKNGLVFGIKQTEDNDPNWVYVYLGEDIDWEIMNKALEGLTKQPLKKAQTKLREIVDNHWFSGWLPYQAAQALSALGDPDDIVPLISYLKEGNLVGLIADKLFLPYDPDLVAGVFGQTLATFNEDDPDHNNIREGVITALGTLKNPQAPLLLGIQLLTEKSENGLLAVVSSLAKQYQSQTNHFLTYKTKLRGAFESVLVNCPSALVINQLAALYGEIYGHEAVTKLKALTDLLTLKLEKETGAKTQSQLAPDEVNQFLIEDWMKHLVSYNDSEVQLMLLGCIYGLGQTQDVNATSYLRSFLNHKFLDADAKNAVLEALGKTTTGTDQQSAGVFSRYLQDEDAHDAAVNALLKITNPSATRALLQTMQTDSNLQRKTNYALALAFKNNEQGFPVIKNYLEAFKKQTPDEEFSAKIKTLKSLATNNFPMFVKLLQYCGYEIDDLITPVFRQNLALLKENYQYQEELKDFHLIAQLKNADIKTLAESKTRVKKMLFNRPYVPRLQNRLYPSELIEDQLDQLSVVESAKIEVLIQALDNDAALRQKITQIIKQDTRDRNSEHGGIVKYQNGQVIFEEYPSFQVGFDGQFIPSAENLFKGVYCLADFHLHALSSDEREFAGPSGSNPYEKVSNLGTVWNYQAGGDLAVAGYQNSDGIVITPIGEGYFNVDYYHAKDIVIDLGIYTFTPN